MKTLSKVGTPTISASKKRIATFAESGVRKKPKRVGRKSYVTPNDYSKKEAKLRTFLVSNTEESANRKVKSPGGTTRNALEYVEPLDDLVSQWSPVTRKEVSKNTVKARVKSMRIFKRRNEITGKCPMCDKHRLVAMRLNALSDDEW